MSHPAEGPETRRVKSAFSALVRWLEGLGGLSRQGVIASSNWVRSRHVPPLPEGSQRALWLLPASLMIGVGVASLAAAELGVAPFDVALSAVAERTPLSLGQSAWAVSGVLFLVAAVLGVRPTSRTISLMFLNGLMIDAAGQVIVTPDGLGSRAAMATVGSVVLVFGVATVVYHAAAGGAFESLMKVAEIRGRRPLVMRSGLEIGFLIGGMAAGGAFGPMTVVIALGMGPAIMTGIQALEDHQVGRRVRLTNSLPESFLSS